MSTGILEKTNILVRLPSESKEEAIRRAAELLQKQGYVNENYYGLMLQRETECTTYIGNGVAIPHGISRSEKDILKSRTAYPITVKWHIWSSESRGKIASIWISWRISPACLINRKM